MLEFSNVEVLWRYHVGDWGTQAFYKASKQRLDSDLEFKERAQQAVVSLQGGEEKYRKAWAQICEISRRGYQRVYQRLGIKDREDATPFEYVMIASHRYWSLLLILKQTIIYMLFYLYYRYFCFALDTKI
ncbi:hypothetical protein ACSBR2_032890 [Camellia fascicularis]